MTYKVILADPPWQYRNNGVEGAAQGEYPTMSTDDICALDVAAVADKDCVLLLWATWPCLTDALRVAQAWGFDYVTGMPWIKLTKCEPDLWGEWDLKTHWGIGFWVRGVSEPILLCRRGNPPRPDKTFVGLLAPNIRHSRKPDSIYAYAEALPGPYLEMFCRRPRPGWHSFGNEISSDVILKRRGREEATA